MILILINRILSGTTMHYLFVGFIAVVSAGILGGCAPTYDYTVHKPRVVFDHPSKRSLHKILRRKLGDEYVWAEEGPHQFDCSGLVYYAYGTMNTLLPRVASAQAKAGKHVSRTQLQYGDLIFFDTTARRTGKITHVGIYIGNGRFEHAANEREGVIITPINHPYYGRRIVTCRRILPDEHREGTQPGTPFTANTRIAADTPEKSTCAQCYKVTDQATDAAGHYYIQVGIFTHTPDSAFLEHLRVSGYGHTIHRVIRKGRPYTQVLVGPFRTREKAHKTLPDTRALFNPAAFVVTQSEKQSEKP
jgi:hypothetical protein